MRINRLATALCALAVVLAACGRAAGPLPSTTGTAGARYAHLGDSFAAGSGIDPTVADSPAMCLRSARNFGQLIAARRGWGPPAFADVSCGGATTANLDTAQYLGVPPQADALGPATELVTMLIGGNDGRLFADAVADCGALAPGDTVGDPCRRAYGAQFDREVADTVAPALRGAVALVARRAPHARIVVVGYPRLLPPTGGCYPTMRVAAGDVAYLNDLQIRLNRAIAAAATAARADYVDLWAVSRDHDACADPDRRWVEPMVGARTRTTVHPNAAGQRAIADAVSAALG